MDEILLNKKKISRLAYGTYKLGGYGWPKGNAASSENIIETAIDQGITVFDTAPIYGHGLAEKILGQALSSHRKNVIIATKCGIVYEGKKATKDLSYDAIMWSLEGSLKRLKTDYIDLYQVHMHDHKTPLLSVANHLIDLKKQGIIREIGVSNFNLEMTQKIFKRTELFSVQNEYSYFMREAETDILPFCQKKKMLFLAYSPLLQGLTHQDISQNSRLDSSDVRNFHPIFMDKSRFCCMKKVVKNMDNPIQNMLSYLVKQNHVIPIISTLSEKHLIENVSYVNEILGG